jgi:hypothetical protein
LELNRADLDLYRRFRFSRGSIVAGGDLAAVDLELDRVQPDSPHTKASGLGVFVEGHHELYRSPAWSLACVGRGRWTQFFAGETDYVFNLRPAGGINSPLFAAETPQTRTANLQVTEAAAGVELARRFGSDEFALECAVEVQSWEVSPVSDLFFSGAILAASVRL